MHIHRFVLILIAGLLAGARAGADLRGAQPMPMRRGIRPLDPQAQAHLEAHLGRRLGEAWWQSPKISRGYERALFFSDQPWVIVTSSGVICVPADDLATQLYCYDPEGKLLGVTDLRP